MSKFLKSVLLLVGLLGLSMPALADTVTFSGSLDGLQPTFDNPETVATTLTGYSTFEFSVDTDGTYSFLSFYPGDTTIDANLDGYLLLFEGSFDPLSGAPSLNFDDDYSAGDVAALAAFDGACVGQNCSGFDAALTAGTSYILVQTSFTDVSNSFGTPTGDYDTTITGPGAISAVPVPAAIWLFASCLAGLGIFRRK